MPPRTPLQLAPNLKLPEEAVTETFAFLARRGAGKTYGAMKLAEQFLQNKAQIVAIDPIGAWWGLRLGADGKSPGFDIPIFGGLRGDIPLEPTGGKLIADLVIDRHISPVLDVSLFHKAERKRFATDFATQLFQRKKTHRSAMHVFIEEAQLFVPQRISHGEETMLGAYEDLIKLGRNFGIGVTLISQRPQAINKDALNQTEILVVLQTNGPQERKALEGWITEQGLSSKELVNELPSLPIGTAYVWSPQRLKVLEKIKIDPRTTFDASATPKLGKTTVVEPRPLSAEELTRLSKEMAETIEHAKANDPKALRAEVASLKAKLASKTVDRVEYVRVPAIPPLHIESLKRFSDGLRKLTEEFIGLVGEASRETTVVANQPPETNWTGRGFRAVAKGPEMPPPAPRTRPAAAPAEKLSKAERLIVTVLAQHGGRCSKERVAFLAGYAVGGGGFNNALSALNTKGLIERGPELALTILGTHAVGDNYEPLPADPLEYWCEKLSKAESAALRVIARAYPGYVTKTAVADAAGYEASGGGFNNALSRLRTLQLITGRSDLRASEALFP